MPEQRDLCLIPVPFSDLRSAKKRPVLILSNDHYNYTNNDILVMAVTSNLTRLRSGVLINHDDMSAGKLRQTSVIRVDKIYSISKFLVIRNFGKISKDKFAEVKTELRALLSERGK